MADMTEKEAIAKLFETDYERTVIGLIDGSLVVREAELQVTMVTSSSDLTSRVGLQIVLPNETGLTFMLADPSKVAAQIAKTHFLVIEENQRMDIPIDLSAIHTRTRGTAQHRTQRAPATKPRRGRK